MKKTVVNLPWRGKISSEPRRYYACLPGYYGMISDFDHKIGCKPSDER